MIAFGLTVVYMLVELTVGVDIGSLALLSDPADMGTDALGLGMASAAIDPRPSLRTLQRTTW